MRIGIIGAGNIGSTLARRLTALGHRVVIANSRGPETLTQLAADTGAVAGTAHEAARDQDLLVITIPERAIPNLPGDLLAGAPEDLVVIDTGNYYPGRDGQIDALELGMPESQWVQRQLGRPVIKAFNTIHFRSLAEKGRPTGGDGGPDLAGSAASPGPRIAIPVAGDDPAAKQLVMQLVEQLGFDPVDTGPLAESWRQQPNTPVYGQDLDAEGARGALAAAVPLRGPAAG